MGQSYFCSQYNIVFGRIGNILDACFAHYIGLKIILIDKRFIEFKLTSHIFEISFMFWLDVTVIFFSTVVYAR